LFNSKIHDLLGINRNYGEKISKRHIEIAGALQRSFENIIQNGSTYGNKVDIEVQKGQNRVLVIVEDDGPGIPEDQYKNVFKPFFRLNYFKYHLVYAGKADKRLEKDVFGIKFPNPVGLAAGFYKNA